jgi:general L-amino acid transport system substrate-binding protein
MSSRCIERPRANRLRSVISGIALLGALVLPPPVTSDTLDAIQARGMLRCGVSEGIAGLSLPDAAGRWTGIDADFCRALAAAVLGDPEKVEFIPLRASTRFPALESRRVDLLARNTTWTLTREALLKVQFPAVLLYDGQGFLVPAGSGIENPRQLDGATLCVEKGTTHVANLRRFAKKGGITLTPLVLDSAPEVAAAFFAGRCTAYSSDATQLAATRLQAPGGPAGYRLLPERISKEPLAPAVWGGDPRWTSAVRWVLYALIMAEEDGVTRANVDTRLASREGLFAWVSMTEHELIAQALGLPHGWAVRALRAVGNYGEMFDRNLGAGSPLGIERGLNRLWTQGGLLYSPPID